MIHFFIKKEHTNFSSTFFKNIISTQIVLFLALLILSTSLFSQNDSIKKVYTFELNDDIFPAAWRTVKKAVNEAEEKEADMLIMKLNTYGGMVNIADSIRTKLLKTEVKTVVLIDNNAASAGALISIACDSIFMVSGAQIGAATVVNEEGTQMPDKYQSYMRATMRSTAETQKRDPKIAEAMVDDRVEIEGVIEKGKTLTFTTSEAIKNGYCDGEVKNFEALLKKLDLEEATIYEYKKTMSDNFTDWLLHPMVSGFLLMIIFGGIYFELQTPGVGFPILASLIAAVLYFAPSYIEGLAENWEIALFIVGLLLLALEVFVIPGFGVAGVAGICAIVIGLSLSLVQNDFFDFTFSAPGSVTSAFSTVIISMALSLVAMFVFGGSLLNSPAFKRMSLETVQHKEDGFTIARSEEAALVGEHAIAITDLRLSGSIEHNGNRYDAVTTGQYLEKGTEVEILEYRGNYYVVRRVV